MVYVIFHRDFPDPGAWGACGLTTWTGHAYDRKDNPTEWEIEAHDIWPERKNGINLLNLKRVKELPEHVSTITREELMEYFEEGKSRG